MNKTNFSWVQLFWALKDSSEDSSFLRYQRAVHHQFHLKPGSFSHQGAGLNQGQERLLPAGTSGHSLRRIEHFDSFSLGSKPGSSPLLQKVINEPRTEKGRGGSPHCMRFSKNKYCFKVKKREITFSVAPHHSLDKSEFSYLALRP